MTFRIIFCSQEALILFTDVIGTDLRHAKMFHDIDNSSQWNCLLPSLRDLLVIRCKSRWVILASLHFPWFYVLSTQLFFRFIVPSTSTIPIKKFVLIVAFIAKVWYCSQSLHFLNFLWMGLWCYGPSSRKRYGDEGWPIVVTLNLDIEFRKAIPADSNAVLVS